MHCKKGSVSPNVFFVRVSASICNTTAETTNSGNDLAFTIRSTANVIQLLGILLVRLIHASRQALNLDLCFVFVGPGGKDKGQGEDEDGRERKRERERE